MRRFSSFAALAAGIISGILFGCTSVTSAYAQAYDANPKLVVIVVIDHQIASGNV